MALINPETRSARIIDSYVNWSENQATGRKSGGIVIEVEFDDGNKMQKLLNLTEKGAEYTVKTLRSLGWQGRTFSDFENPQLVGMAVSVVLADSVDKDGNVRLDDQGKPFREIAFINKPRGYKRATKAEADSLAHHFDRYLQDGRPPQPSNTYATMTQQGLQDTQGGGYQSGPDDDLPF